MKIMYKKEWHWMDNKKKRQYRSNQGRSPKQLKSSYIGIGISGLGLIALIIYILIDKYVL